MKKPKIKYRKETIVVSDSNELADAMRKGYGTIIVNDELNDLMKQSMLNSHTGITVINNFLSATTLLALFNPAFLAIPVVGKLLEGNAKNYNVVEEEGVIKFVYTTKF